MSGSNAYIGMCQPYNPDDNYRLATREFGPTNAYFVPNVTDKGNYRAYDYYPVKVVPVSDRHAVVIERSGGRYPGDKYTDVSRDSFIMYKVNLNGGVYDPAVEECADPTDDELRIVWDQYAFNGPDNCLIDAVSPSRDRVVVVMREFEDHEAGTVYEEEIHPEEFNKALEEQRRSVNYSYRQFRLTYTVLYFDVTHKKDIRLIRSDTCHDNVLVPKQSMDARLTTRKWVQEFGAYYEGLEVDRPLLRDGAPYTAFESLNDDIRRYNTSYNLSLRIFSWLSYGLYTARDHEPYIVEWFDTEELALAFLLNMPFLASELTTSNSIDMPGDLFPYKGSTNTNMPSAAIDYAVSEFAQSIAGTEMPASFVNRFASVLTSWNGYYNFVWDRITYGYVQREETNFGELSELEVHTIKNYLTNKIVVRAYTDGTVSIDTQHDVDYLIAYETIG